MSKEGTYVENLGVGRFLDFYTFSKFDLFCLSVDRSLVLVRCNSTITFFAVVSIGFRDC